MNIFRIFRLGPVSDLPATAVVDAIVASSTEDTARQLMTAEYGAEDVDWSDRFNVRVTHVGMTAAPNSPLNVDHEAYVIMSKEQQAVPRG